MSSVRMIVLGVAVLAAALAAFMAKALISSPTVVEAAPAPTMAVQRVLVLTKDVPIGERIQGADLRWQEWPEEAIAPYFITESKAPKAIDKFIGSVVRASFYMGEPFVPAKIIDPESTGFLAAMLRPGMRAVSIEISADTGAGGFILPNDKVDVILTRRIDNRDRDSADHGFRSDTVIRNVRVLAIDQVYKEIDDKQVVVGNTATLELPPQHAEVLALAVAMGDVSLSLRSFDGTPGAYSAEPEIATDIVISGGGGGNAVTVLKFGHAKTILPGALN